MDPVLPLATPFPERPPWAGKRKERHRGRKILNAAGAQERKASAVRDRKAMAALPFSKDSRSWASHSSPTTGAAPPSAAHRSFVSHKIGRLLNWLQVISAMTCVALSVMLLWKHDFGGEGASNMRPALLLFYMLAFVEASLFLLEKAYWEWKVSACKLLQQVSDECELGLYGLVSLTRFL